MLLTGYVHFLSTSMSLGAKILEYRREECRAVPTRMTRAFNSKALCKNDERTLHYTAHATCDSRFQHHFEASICDGFGPEPQENTHAWILSDVFEESFQISIDLCNPLLLHRSSQTVAF